jgi:hypothetical protein
VRALSVTTATVVLVAGLVAGCGGSSAAGKIAGEAKARTGARDANCTKAGIMVFVGARQDVYDCHLTGVDSAHRPISQFDQSSINLCYVYASGTVYDVTERLNAMSGAGGDTSGFACVAPICPGGKTPLRQRPDVLGGQTIYDCGDGNIVTVPG